jgi:L,D-transpeptidase catalytic domain
LIDLEGQEESVNRAGICLHGGGSACGWPDAWTEYQTIYPTHGCIRMYNKDLQDLILPLVDKGTVYISVYQEA